MATVTIASGLLSDLNATPAVKHGPHVLRGYQREVVGIVAVGTNNTVGDVWSAVRVHSSDRLSHLYVTNDQLDSNGVPTLKVNIGFYQTAANGGAAVGATKVASALAFGHTAGGPTDELALSAADAGKAIWELLGLTEDPAVDYDISLAIDVVAATAAAGNVAVKACLVDNT